MTKGDLNLLREIERDVLDENVSIAATLRKCVVLGGHANSAALRAWANRELQGYQLEDELPAYRLIGAAIKINAVLGPNQVTGQHISPRQLPKAVQDRIDEELPIRWGVAEIEQSARQADGEVNITFGHSADVAALMTRDLNQPFQQITAVYWAVSRAALLGIVDQVRTQLAHFVAELRASMPPGQEVLTAEAVSQALGHVNAGDHATFNVTAMQSSSGGQSTATVSTTANPEPRRESPWWNTTGARLVWGRSVPCRPARG